MNIYFILNHICLIEDIITVEEQYIIRNPRKCWDVTVRWNLKGPTYAQEYQAMDTPMP